MWEFLRKMLRPSAKRLGEELLQAAGTGRKDEVERLLAAGADVNAKTPTGETALLRALEHNTRRWPSCCWKGAQTRMPRTRQRVTALQGAAERGYASVVNLLIAKGASVNARGRYGYTPLHMAAVNGQKEVVQCLLDNGAEANNRADEGRTPLFGAVQGGHVQVCELLLAGSSGRDYADYRRRLHPAPHGRPEEPHASCGVLDRQGGTPGSQKVRWQHSIASGSFQSQ